VFLRTRLRITTAASLAAIPVLALVLSWALLESFRASDKAELAGAMMREQYERSLLRDEYLSYREARVLKQWEAKTAMLSKDLERAAGEFHAPEHRETISEMTQLMHRTTLLFRGIVERDEGSARGERKRELAEEFRSRATTQLRFQAHELYLRAGRLATSASARFHETQRRTALIVVLLFLLVFANILVNNRVVSVTLARRITLLRDGAEQVAAGALDHRIGIQGNDELAELGESFDRMTGQLQQHVAALEVSNRELESFSYAVSHDLRAPLRSVAGFSQAALEDYGEKLDAKGRQYLELASEAAREMGQLIDDLLGLSRVSRVEMERCPVDLSALARSIVDELRRAEPDRSVEVEVAPELIAEGDPTLLRLVLDNLLRNSWKFTSRHPTARITVGLAHDRGRDAFFVSDDGAGFEMAYVEKLFQPFQRLHRTIEFPGTGIGLATVNRIVRRHGGEAWAHGEVEKGATIYFTLSGEPHGQQSHPAGRGQPEGRAPDGAGLQAEQDRERAPRRA
jgi:signal transduction histidine kinase